MTDEAIVARPDDEDMGVGHADSLLDVGPAGRACECQAWLRLDGRFDHFPDEAGKPHNQHAKLQEDASRPRRRVSRSHDCRSGRNSPPDPARLYPGRIDRATRMLGGLVLRPMGHP